jgi:thymidine phosphorylase
MAATSEVVKRFTPKLRLRRLPVDTYHEAVAYLPRRSTVYRPAEFQALAKVEIRGDGRRVIAVLNVIDHDDMLAPDEVGLSQQGFEQFGVPEGTAVEVVQAARPESLEAVRRKIQGEELTADDLDTVIRDIAGMRYSKMEIAAFLIASASFLSTNEVLELTRAMTGIERVRSTDSILHPTNAVQLAPLLAEAVRRQAAI